MTKNIAHKANKIFSTVCFVVILTILFWGIESVSALTLQMGGTQTPQHPGTEAAKEFAKIVEEKSGGKIQAKVLFGGVVGGEREIVEGVQLGNIEMGWVSDIGMATVVPGVGFAYLPYLCTSYEEVQEKYYNGWIGEIVKKRLSKANIELLAFMDNDFRWITNSKHPILKPEDLKGLSIRVPEIPELIKFFDELGAQPTTMAVTEVVPALQQGAVDGQDNGAILNYTYGFHEFQPYMTVTNHVFSGGGLIVNKNLWDSLSSEEQQIIKEAADKCAGMANKKLRSNIPEYINKMREGGARIDKPTPALDKAMQEAAQRVWNDPRNAKRYGEEVINKIVN